MSADNVELLRAFHEELARASQEDMDPAVAAASMARFWHPEVEYDMSESPVLDIGGSYEGAEACQRFWREWFAAWETLLFEYELVEASDRVVTLLDLRLRGRSTGIDVPFGKHAFVTTFRDGLIFRSKLYMSQAEALEAAGLSE